MIDEVVADSLLHTGYQKILDYLSSQNVKGEEDNPILEIKGIKEISGKHPFYQGIRIGFTTAGLGVGRPERIKVLTGIVSLVENIRE